ncbi:hypothetical protein [Bradyrhizobium elkanii]|uniref:hypothetical protein n=1 Tax=Bradyrhizobium elkanii TaxID=29448 RepID=UPI0004B31317|nr:hypothetical protein [Bradyrhizobium elkanii]WLA83255.1 hypothetical protein QNJ99_02635 [Bradyrhizobium elkanii]
MLITPSLVLSTNSTARRARLSFLFATLDDKVVGLTSDWLTNGSDTFKIEVRSDQQTIGIGELPSPPSSENEKIGPAHCAFVFSLDERQTIAPAFGRLKRALPVRSIGGALGQKVSILGLRPSISGVVLPHYDDAELEVAGSRRSVFPLLAVRFKNVAALRRQFKVLNGAMLEDEEGLLVGIVIGRIDNALLAAPIADLLDAHNLSFLSEDRIAAWNRKRERNDENWDPGELPPIPENSMLDQLTSRKVPA